MFTGKSKEGILAGVIKPKKMARAKFSAAATAFAHSLTVTSGPCELPKEDMHDDIKREHSMYFILHVSYISLTFF